MAQNPANMDAGLNAVVSHGNASVSAAAQLQWVADPSVCPVARCLSGKISEMNTQITAPCPIECANTKAKIHGGTNHSVSVANAALVHASVRT